MREKGKEAFEIIEEAVHLLRFSPISHISMYYIGSLPFILGFLYFWADMSRNGLAEDHCAGAAFGLAMLFFWMKFWQAEFALQILFRLGLNPSSRRRWVQVVNRAMTQAILQPTGIFVLPVALLLTIPFGWCYAFYQNLSALPDDTTQDLAPLCKISWRHATLWTRQNHILLFFLFIFGVFIFLNMVAAVFLFPYLLKTFLGIETIFTLSGFNALNTTFLAAVVGITYLCVDPLIKTVYALRCYYGLSLNTGDDLKIELKQIARYGKTLIMVFIVLISCSSPAFPSMESSHSTALPFAAEEQEISITPKKLDHSIEEVLKRQKFIWRMPREKLLDQNRDLPGPLRSFVEWIKESLKTSIDAIKEWIRDIKDWFTKHQPKDHQKETTLGKGWLDTVNDLLNMILIVLLGVLIILLWKIWRKRKRLSQVIAVESSLITPDPALEEMSADALPADQWLVLAKELMDKGMLRLALRAYFLATLADLADQGIITITRFKSNQDFDREVRRRAHEKPRLLDVFSSLARLFDRVWYGMYDVTSNDVSFAASGREEIMKILCLEKIR